MNARSTKPIIFLAFANDHQSYLYKLTEEQDGIRTALESAETNGLCEVVYETDTNIDKIFKTFDKYQDRIAIFHYGGHAEDYTLLLKEADGKRQYANSEGLVAFLAQQKGLQLVFINGCCSKQQAEKLRREGIPAVVGTSQPIDDAAATVLSTQFYESLAAGRTIDQAWQAAEAKVKTKTDSAAGYRAIGSLEDKSSEARISFPWELYIRPGAESVKKWNLPRSSRNPLFGLPLPETYYRNLPPAPFLGLHYFEQKDAAIFFGRGGQIRELYSHISGVHPIILFYGKSGVGKSSLLYAGLLPRIDDKYSVIYVRRDQETGLSGTLNQALSEGSEPESGDGENQRQESIDLLKTLKAKIADKALQRDLTMLIENYTSRTPAEIPAQLPDILKKWLAIEDRDGRPLIVILDQVEEKYTRPMPDDQETEDELIQFLSNIRSLFAESASGIRGKLILSYRKEYHPEIRDTFQAMSLPYAEVFLKRLDREGIMEAVDGATREVSLQTKYRLEIDSTTENSLPAIIADDLLEDKESPIAPVLQIILKKLWESAQQENEDTPCLTVARYQQLKKDGITMGEFFEQQMEQLAKKIPRAVGSGLALDLLNAHTTTMGTAGRCRREDVEIRYPDRQEMVSQLLQACLDLSLLLKIGKDGTILAHDTLAPVVIREYNASDAPGQRASRILRNKISGSAVNGRDVYLDGADLAVVEEGLSGMRQLDETGEKLLQISREKRAQRRRRRILSRSAWAIMAVALIASGIWYIWGWDTKTVSGLENQFQTSLQSENPDLSLVEFDKQISFIRPKMFNPARLQPLEQSMVALVLDSLEASVNDMDTLKSNLYQDLLRNYPPLADTLNKRKIALLETSYRQRVSEPQGVTLALYDSLNFWLENATQVFGYDRIAGLRNNLDEHFKILQSLKIEYPSDSQFLVGDLGRGLSAELKIVIANPDRLDSAAIFLEGKKMFREGAYWAGYHKIRPASIPGDSGTINFTLNVVIDDGSDNLIASRSFPAVIKKMRGKPLSPKNHLDEKAVTRMIQNDGFYDGNRNNITKGYTGRFMRKKDRYRAIKKENDMMVYDRATGLMWQTKGSIYKWSAFDRASFIDSLNSREFGGYRDWRLPTLEELMSLTEPDGIYHIESVFIATAHYGKIWSADNLTDSATDPGAWYVDFKEGRCSPTPPGVPRHQDHFYVRGVRSGK